MNPDDALAALTDATTVLAAAGVESWLTDGTLLGCVREGGFIPHDDDVDVAVMSDFDEAAACTALEGADFRMVQRLGGEPDGLELRFQRRGVPLDIFVFYPDGDTMWHAAWLDGNMIRFRYPAFDRVPLELHGRVFLGPEDPEEYLAIKYGPDWRVPRTDWHWAYSPLNAEHTQQGLMYQLRRLVRQRREGFR